MEIFSAGILHLQEIDILHAGLCASSGDKLKNTWEGKNCMVERNEGVMGKSGQRSECRDGGPNSITHLSFGDLHLTPMSATLPTQDTNCGSSFFIISTSFARGVDFQDLDQQGGP